MLFVRGRDPRNRSQDISFTMSNAHSVRRSQSVVGDRVLAARVTSARQEELSTEYSRERIDNLNKLRLLLLLSCDSHCLTTCPLVHLVLVLVLVVVRAFNRLSEIHTARSEPALGYDCDVRTSAQTPPWVGEYQVGSSGASGRGSEERELNLPRRHLRIAARASRTPSTANRTSLRDNCRGPLRKRCANLLGELAVQHVQFFLLLWLRVGQGPTSRHLRDSPEYIK